MTTTHSGRLLLPQNYAVPSLYDIAIQSGRIVRFAGACRTHWTVLHHLLVCTRILDITHPYASSEQHLVALLHDADEVATGDIPTLWKTDEMRRSVDALQARVYEEYLGRLPTSEERCTNKGVDLLALAAEMEVVGPPDVLHHGGLRWVYLDGITEAKEAVSLIRDTYPGPENTMFGLDSSAVHDYLHALIDYGVRDEWGELLAMP